MQEWSRNGPGISEAKVLKDKGEVEKEEMIQ